MEIGQTSAQRAVMRRAPTEPETRHSHQAVKGAQDSLQAKKVPAGRFDEVHSAMAMQAPGDLDSAAVLAALRPTDVQTTLLPRVVLAPDNAEDAIRPATDGAVRRATQGFEQGRAATTNGSAEIGGSGSPD